MGEGAAYKKAWVGANEFGATSGHTLGALSALARNKNRNAKRRSFLLDASRVGDDQGSPRQKSHEIGVV